MRAPPAKPRKKPCRVKLGPNRRPTTNPVSSPTTIIPNTDGGGERVSDPVEESVVSGRDVVGPRLRVFILRSGPHHCFHHRVKN